MTSEERTGRPADARVRRYIMIGAPVTKVRSPPMLVEDLAGKGVTAEIGTRHVEPGELQAFMQEVSADRRVDGLLVTMPHKKAILPLMASVSDLARAAGSVNTVKRMDTGAWVGAQFDGTGLIRALAAAGTVVESSHILLAGVGGAGFSIALAIAARGCHTLSILDQDAAARARVIDELTRRNAPATAASGVENEPYDILINATPLGMNESDPSPFAQDLVAGARFVADIVADPSQTRLAAMTKTTDAILVTGREMVRGQIGPIGDWLIQDGYQQATP